MLRLRKYLKPYIFYIILSVGLLFIQANADLALPDYLSRIVNNGIQQNGVENAVPEAIRQAEMDKLTLFMGPEDRDRVLAAYQLAEPDSPDAGQYLDDYPALASEPIYVLKDVGQDEIEALEPILGRAFVAVSGLQAMVDDPTQAPPRGAGFDFDPAMIPEGMDLFQVLAMMPPDRLDEMMARMNEMFDALGDSMVSQMAVGVVKTEYEALGMDPAKVQQNYILRTGGMMLLISLVGGVCTIAVSFLASRTAADRPLSLTHGISGRMFSRRSKASRVPSSISSPRPPSSPVRPTISPRCSE